MCLNSSSSEGSSVSVDSIVNMILMVVIGFSVLLDLRLLSSRYSRLVIMVLLEVMMGLMEFFYVVRRVVFLFCVMCSFLWKWVMRSSV